MFQNLWSLLIISIRLFEYVRYVFFDSDRHSKSSVFRQLCLQSVFPHSKPFSLLLQFLCGDSFSQPCIATAPQVLLHRLQLHRDTQAGPDSEPEKFKKKENVQIPMTDKQTRGWIMFKTFKHTNLAGTQLLDLQMFYLLQTGLSALDHLLSTPQLLLQLLQLCLLLKHQLFLLLQPTAAMCLQRGQGRVEKCEEG